ncbi:hypothetical protein MK079_03880 [Candidatus Gracilibacteria bacterium]|nr:hypothetical protein [Candidatus Gracilibacteria bacterium]
MQMGNLLGEINIFQNTNEVQETIVYGELILDESRSQIRQLSTELKAISGYGEKIQYNWWIETQEHVESIEHDSLLRQEVRGFYDFFVQIDKKEYEQINGPDFLEYVKGIILKNTDKFPLVSEQIKYMNYTDIIVFLLQNGVYVFYDIDDVGKVVTPVLETRTLKIQDLFSDLDLDINHNINFSKLKNHNIIKNSFYNLQSSEIVFSSDDSMYKRNVTLLKKGNPQAKIPTIWEYVALVMKGILSHKVLKEKYNFSPETPLNWDNYKKEEKDRPKTNAQVLEFLNLSQHILGSEMEVVLLVEDMISNLLTFRNGKVVVLSSKIEFFDSVFSNLYIYSDEETEERIKIIVDKIPKAKNDIDLQYLKTELAGEIIKIFFENKKEIQKYFQAERNHILEFIEKEVPIEKKRIKQREEKLKIPELAPDLQEKIDKIETKVWEKFPGRLVDSADRITFEEVLFFLIEETKNVGLINISDEPESIGESAREVFNYFKKLGYIVSPVPPFFVRADKIEDISLGNIDGLKLLFPGLKDKKVTILHHPSRNWENQGMHLFDQIILFPNNLYKPNSQSNEFFEWSTSRDQAYYSTIGNELLHHIIDSTYNLQIKYFIYDIENPTLKKWRSLLDKSSYKYVEEFLSDVVSINTNQADIARIFSNMLSTKFEGKGFGYTQDGYFLTNTIMYLTVKDFLKNKNGGEEVIALMKKMRTELSPEFRKTSKNKQEYQKTRKKIMYFLLTNINDSEIETIKNLYLGIGKELVRQLPKKS